MISVKPSYEPSNFNAQLSNLKTSLAYWDDLINKSNKLTASLGVTLQSLAGFVEAFQKISDIAETNNAGLRPFGIALRRFCLRQRCVESRLRSFNGQITECLVTPLADRLDEWRRTANQMDRDCVKEIRKAKSELQRAMIETEKCKKRLRRKQERSGSVTGAFDSKDEGCDRAPPSVQFSFAQHDLACKQRALESLEQRCLEAVAVEERRRFAELATCLSPLLEAHLSVLAEMRPLEESLREIQASKSVVMDSASATTEMEPQDTNPPPTSTENSELFLRATPLVKQTTNGNAQPPPPPPPPLDPTIATGSAALSFAVAPAPSSLSISSTATSNNGGGLLGHTESVSTLQGSAMPPPPQATSAGLGFGTSGSDYPLNGGAGGGVDALSLFDHNQSISGAPTLRSTTSSSSSLGLLPINCDAASALGSLANSTSPTNGSHQDFNATEATNGTLEGKVDVANGDEEDNDEEEDGGTTEGCLTEEDDDMDETLDVTASNTDVQGNQPGSAHPNDAKNMEKSVLYPNQALPPPVYTNFSKLQAAAQRGVGGPPNTGTTSEGPPRSATPPLGHYDNNHIDGRKFSHPTATISKGGMATLLRSLSISGAKPGGLAPPGAPPQQQTSLTLQHPPPPPLQSILNPPGCGEGAGEGLGMSPPHTSSTTPVIADQALSSNQSAPNSPSSSYAEARSRINAMFSNPNAEQQYQAHPQQLQRLSISPPNYAGEFFGQSSTSSGIEGLDLGAGNTSTFRRRGRGTLPSQLNLSQAPRTAGINLMRGSMFQLNTASSSLATPAPTNENDPRFAVAGAGSGLVNKTTPMTPGPGRRAPIRSQLSTSNEPNGFLLQQHHQQQHQTIRPPRRSSSVCRELPSLCHQPQQPQPSFHQQPHQQHQFFPPRGIQQHPQRVYADPRDLQQSGSSGNASSAASSSLSAAQLASEAAAVRRNQQQQQQQQYAAPSGLRNPVVGVSRSGNQSNLQYQQQPQQPQQLTHSRLPTRQTSSSNASVRGTKNSRANATRDYYGNYYGTGVPQPQQTMGQTNYGGQNYAQQQQQQNQDYPPPPAAFDDVESTSFIESPGQQ